MEIGEDGVGGMGLGAFDILLLNWKCIGACTSLFSKCLLARKVFVGSGFRDAIHVLMKR